jgi:hypothetical protein
LSGARVSWKIPTGLDTAYRAAIDKMSFPSGHEVVDRVREVGEVRAVADWWALLRRSR